MQHAIVGSGEAPADPEKIGLYPADPLTRAQLRAWVENGTATLTDAWGF